VLDFVCSDHTPSHFFLPLSLIRNQEKNEIADFVLFVFGAQQFKQIEG
jgi:hypothetical protein